MEDLIKDYLVEIGDVGWVSEVIAERFDNALKLMTPNSIIYGGAVRDSLAGFDLVGDLDISVPHSEFAQLSENFSTDTRWLPEKNVKKPEGPDDSLAPTDTDDSDDLPIPSMDDPPPSLLSTAPIINSGDLATAMGPMNSITSFRTINGSIVQLIRAKKRGEEAIDEALHIARVVDIACCGMVMLKNGKVFEAIPGAWDDCQNRVLKFNKFSESAYIKVLPQRIEKLVGRGWQNQIDADSEIAAFEKRAKIIARKHAKRAEIKFAGHTSHSPHGTRYKLMSISAEAPVDRWTTPADRVREMQRRLSTGGKRGFRKKRRAVRSLERKHHTSYEEMKTLPIKNSSVGGRWDYEEGSL